MGPPMDPAMGLFRGHRMNGSGALAAVAAFVLLGGCRRSAPDGVGPERCGRGFRAEGARCLPLSLAPPAESPRVPIGHVRVDLRIADWERPAEPSGGTIEVKPFAIDAFEMSCAAVRPWVHGGDAHEALLDGGVECAPGGEALDGDWRAASLSFDAARLLCRLRGGRLPTDAEWVGAASAAGPRRYPWGDTGATCRRAAWALVDGPCATGAVGPDSVGAHEDGQTPLGIHDLAGNVAEWTEHEDGPRLRGGSYRTSLAAGLRIWAYATDRSGALSADRGARCAFDLD
jgi:hypothetical protein